MKAGADASPVQDAFRRSEDEIREELASARARTAAELRERIANGYSDPEPLIRLAKLLPPEDRLRLLREACATDGLTRRGSRQIHVAYVKALWKFNRTEEAVRAAEDALRMFPGDPWFEIKRALALPIVYDRPAEICRWRNRFETELAELPGRVRFETAEQRQAALDAAGRHANFILQYQMENDRDLQRRYSALVRRILSASYPEFLDDLPMPKLAPGERMRVGFISAHFNPHVVSKLFSGWITQRNRAESAAYCYQIRGEFEASAEAVREASDQCREIQGDFAGACAAIRADRLHAAIFLDVGMEPMITLLAEARLAPVQCVTWGHPVTTGSANMDYFLSSELMEPGNGDEHYAERLIRLPGIGVYYRKPMIVKPLIDARRSRFGLREQSIVYLCCQSMFKYLPEHDDIFIRIAQKLPAAQFVFLALNPEIGRSFGNRLKRSFEEAGLDFERHCVILPHLNPLDYSAINLVSDVYLDSLEWSGFNTTMEALACRLPVVTLPGGLMRGRHSYAILTQLGVTETIARDKDEYVEIAVRLGENETFREHVVQRMAARESRIHCDTRSVIALEEFLRAAVQARQHA